ncbi:hypothetical protein [Enterococcus sp. AZ007]|uniref:hypothetical protein n=1 Tax=Enterococcus sp. AZ007 TaxID=2774839 RepID=UPI003F2812A7
MGTNTINYKNLNYLALIRFGHRIGCGWYSILVKAEMELRDLGYTIEDVTKYDGALSITTGIDNNDISSKAQNILYEAEQTSEMTCESCGNYSVAQTIVDNSLCTLCEECQNNLGSLSDVEKRLLKQHIFELEQQILRKNQEIQIQENRVEHFKMGLNHYKKRSEQLAETLETGSKKPKIRVEK